MTYQKIFDLKFNKKVSTVKLQKTFPNETGKIGRIALMELPAKTLKRLISDQKKLKRILKLKQILQKRKASLLKNA